MQSAEVKRNWLAMNEIVVRTSRWSRVESELNSAHWLQSELKNKKGAMSEDFHEEILIRRAFQSLFVLETFTPL